MVRLDHVESARQQTKRRGGEEQCLSDGSSGVAIHRHPRANRDVSQRPGLTVNDFGRDIPPLHRVDDDVNVELGQCIDELVVPDFLATRVPRIERVAHYGDPEACHGHSPSIFTAKFSGRCEG